MPSMKGVARLFSRMGGNPVNIAIHELGVADPYSSTISRLLEDAINAVKISDTSPVEKDAYYDRIIGKLRSFNNLDYFNVRYSADTPFEIGINNRNAAFIYALFRAGADVTKGFPYSSFIRYIVVNSPPFENPGKPFFDAPTTIDLVKKAMYQAPMMLNKLYRGGGTLIDHLDWRINYIESSDTNPVMRDSYRELLPQLIELGAVHSIDILNDPKKVLDIVNQPGLKYEITNFRKLRSDRVFQIPTESVRRIWLNQRNEENLPNLCIVGGFVYIYSRPLQLGQSMYEETAEVLYVGLNPLREDMTIDQVREYARSERSTSATGPTNTAGLADAAGPTNTTDLIRNSRRYKTRKRRNIRRRKSRRSA
jgi:hypothetical protein